MIFFKRNLINLGFNLVEAFLVLKIKHWNLKENVYFVLTGWPLSEESRYVITFIAPRGCYRYQRTLFGLSDAREAF